MDKTIQIHKDSNEVLYLISNDERLRIINFIGDLELVIHTDYFISLCKLIIGQQLSLITASTIWDRVLALCSDINPHVIIGMSEDILRSIGISRAKIQYIKNLAIAINEKYLDLNNIDNLDNDEIIDKLISIKGIGRWTAEMFLIFSLGRLDVFSAGDGSIKRAINWLYSRYTPIDNNKLIEISSKWSPYRTIASLYLWELIDKGIITRYKNYEEFKFNNEKL